MRIITTDLDNILSLVSNAETYGYDRDILYVAFADLLEKTLTDEEIESYSKSIGKMDGYGKEDVSSVRDSLIRFRNKYC